MNNESGDWVDEYKILNPNHIVIIHVENTAINNNHLELNLFAKNPR
nr:hypothetical protein [Mycoplasmopsis felis]